MNRSERRKNKIEQKEPTMTIKRSYFDAKMKESYQKGYEKGRKVNTSEGVEMVFAMLLGLPMKVLKDKYGWGTKKRLPDFAEAVLEEYRNFDESSESLEQMQEFIFQESGIKFVETE